MIGIFIEWNVWGSLEVLEVSEPVFGFFVVVEGGFMTACEI